MDTWHLACLADDSCRQLCIDSAISSQHTEQSSAKVSGHVTRIAEHVFIFCCPKGKFHDRDKKELLMSEIKAKAPNAIIQQLLGKLSMGATKAKVRGCCMIVTVSGSVATARLIQSNVQDHEAEGTPSASPEVQQLIDQLKWEQ